ncbi:hypothetical protein ACFYE2_14885 [Kocuria sp. CPCC 205300]|uniref:TRAFAC clade GTPase domain-containing protein n=1 Tax=Kocuria sabuli TaxID=3071448 RepID=UPI0036DCEAB1
MKEIKIQALGPAGCGKTALMTSAYSCLRLEREGYSFYLKADDRNAKSLTTLHQEPVDPHQRWPIPTQDTKEWKFSLVVHAEKEDFELFRIKYLDYPGEILTSTEASETKAAKRVLKDARSADVLLIFLDGGAINALMRDEKEGPRYLDSDLAICWDIAQQSRSPLQFVITKWDLLAGNYTLAQVKQRLLLEDNIKDVIRAKKARGEAETIRLIPTTTLKKDSQNVAPNSNDGKLVALRKPWNVEIPWIAALFSIIGSVTQNGLERDMLGFASRLPGYRKALNLLTDSLSFSGGTDKVVNEKTILQAIQTVADLLEKRITDKKNQGSNADSRKSSEPDNQGSTKKSQRPSVGSLFVKGVRTNPELAAQTLAWTLSKLLETAQKRSATGLDAQLAAQRLKIDSQREAKIVLESNLAAILFVLERELPDSILTEVRAKPKELSK